MNIIEIDITNACIHSCSNCTRFCGHHQRPFFMGFDTFKKAIDSLEDWNGCIGIIGGEPTLHPQFERFMDYLRAKRIHTEIKINREPIFDMQLHTVAYMTQHHSRVGLLSSVTDNFYKHYETINDTFASQYLNDHDNLCEHQALLMSRKELGISDDEWYKKRDACWIQNTWSATITPKGAFFCEVAGALDMLFNGPGGWKIEKGWYEREPKDFGEQLNWCEMCSGCLDVPKRVSNDELDDVTPQMFGRLQSIGSPKALAGRCAVREPKDYGKYKETTFTSTLEYIERGDGQRISGKNNRLNPRNLLFATTENFAEIVNVNSPDWIAFFPCEINSDTTEKIKEICRKYVLNPGCLYVFDNAGYLFNVHARSIRDLLPWSNVLVERLQTAYPPDKIIGLDLSLADVKGLACYLKLKPTDSDELFRQKKIIVYGAKMVAHEVIKMLHHEGYKNLCVAVTSQANNPKVIMGYSVQEITALKEYADKSIVLIAAVPHWHKEIINNLEQLGFREYRFVR